MDGEQLEGNTSVTLTNATRENAMKNGQILDQEEHATTESMDDANAEGHSPAKRAHTFYFVKFQPFELDKRMQCRIEQAKLEIKKRRKEIEDCKNELTSMKPKRNGILLDLSYSKPYMAGYSNRMSAHKEYIWNEELKNEETNHQRSKEDELPDLMKEKHRIRKDRLNSGDEKRITYLNHRIQNQRLTSKEETTLLKLIKGLETTRDKAIDDAAEASLQDKWWCDYTVRSDISRMGKQHKSVEKYVIYRVDHRWKQTLPEQTQQIKRVSHLWKNFEVVDREMQKLERKLHASTLKMEKAHCVILNSEKIHDDKNVVYHRNCELLDEAKALAEQSDLSALAELSDIELKKFFLQWNNNMEFREDYKSRVIPSLESRGLNLDGSVVDLN